MTDKQKIKILSHCFEDVIWMAIRYANGRHTFAPSTVRDAIREFNKVYPDWKPKHDDTLKPPKDEEVGGMSFKSDFLYDLFSKNESK